MSIISQAAVILLILFMISILIRSNHELDEAAVGGEHFVDSWAIAQAKKEEYQLTGKTGEEEMDFADREEEEDDMASYDQEEEEAEEENVPMTRTLEPEIGFLLLDEEGHPDRSVMIDHVPFSIGHGSGNDLVLDDLSVARNHCIIDEAEGKYYLNDLGSGTGTYVDGKRTDNALLERGMHIFLGASELIVER